jgi:tetratricopeptide (TPR) repeat protein
LMAAVLNAQSQVLQSMGRIEQAIVKQNESLEINREIGDEEGQAISLHQLSILSMLHRMQGDLETALARCREAEVLARDVGNEALVAATLHQQGLIFNWMVRAAEDNAVAGDRREAAAERFQVAYEVSRRIGNEAGAADSLGELGKLLRDAGEYQKAVAAFNEYVETQQRLSNPTKMGIGLEWLGTVHEMQGQVRAALEKYRQALALLQRYGSSQHSSIVQQDIARIEKTINHSSVEGIDPGSDPISLSEIPQTISKTTSDSSPIFEFNSAIPAFETMQTFEYIPSGPLEDESSDQTVTTSSEEASSQNEYYYITPILSFPDETTVGEEFLLTVKLRLGSKPHNDDIRVPQTVQQVYCFITADGFKIKGSEVALVITDPLEGNERSVIFDMQAEMIGRRDFSVSLFIDIPEAGNIDIHKMDGKIKVLPPPVIEDRSSITPQIDIRVTRKPDFVLSVTSDKKDGSNHLTYYLTSRLPGLHLEAKKVGSVDLSVTEIMQIRLLLHKTIRKAYFFQPGDARDLVITFGKYLFDKLFPQTDATVFRSALWQAEELLSTWLIYENRPSWLPWELIVPYHESMKEPPRFLAEQYHLSRWVSGLGPPLYHEVPMGEIALVPYTLSETGTEEQEQRLLDWQALLKSPGFNSIQSVLRSDTPFYGMHLSREAASIAARRDLVARCASKATGSPEKNIEKARLYSRLKRPVVTLSILKRSNVDVQADTDACLLSERVLPFLRAGASAVVCPQWPTSESADQVFWPTFYDLLARRLPLGEVMWRSRMAVQQAKPDSFDWLAYTLFGDPQARAYWPEPSEGYAVLECLNPDTPLRPGKTYTFRASLRNRPPLWYTDRLVQPEALPEKLFALFLVPGIQSKVSDPIEMKPMGRTMLQATVHLTPLRSGDYPILVQLLDGDEHIKTLQLTLKVREEKNASDAERGADE